MIRLLLLFLGNFFYSLIAYGYTLSPPNSGSSWEQDITSSCGKCPMSFNKNGKADKVIKCNTRKGETCCPKVGCCKENEECIPDDPNFKRKRGDPAPNYLCCDKGGYNLNESCCLAMKRFWMPKTDRCCDYQDLDAEQLCCYDDGGRWILENGDYWCCYKDDIDISQNCCEAFDYTWDETNGVCCEKPNESEGCCKAFDYIWTNNKCCSEADINTDQMCCEAFGYIWINGACQAACPVGSEWLPLEGEQNEK